MVAAVAVLKALKAGGQPKPAAASSGGGGGE